MSQPKYIAQAREYAASQGLDGNTFDSVLAIVAHFEDESGRIPSKMTKEYLESLGTVYKYRGTEGEHDWKILETSTLFFSNPKYFNDPFDANIPFQFDALSDAELQSRFARVVHEMNPHAGWYLRKSLISKYINAIRSPEKLDPVSEKWIKRLIDKVGMFCMCPERDNQLLWSHYADSHKGYAIGFDTKELYDFYTENQVFLMGHVAYRKEYPVLLPPPEGDYAAKTDGIVSILNIKSDIWRYENEIRMTVFESNQSIEFKPKLIKEIVLGVNISQANAAKAKQLVRDRFPHATVYKAKLGRYSYSLDFDKVN